MARPTKFTQETIDKICEAIRSGAHPEIAAGFAGVSIRTFWRWYERGKTARRGEYRDFAAAIDRADHTAEVSLAATVRKAGNKDWRAAREILRARYPERWARPDKVDVTAKVEHAGGVIIEATPVMLPAEEVDPVAQLGLEVAAAKKVH